MAPSHLPQRTLSPEASIPWRVPSSAWQPPVYSSLKSSNDTSSKKPSHNSFRGELTVSWFSHHLIIFHVTINHMHDGEILGARAEFHSSWYSQQLTFRNCSLTQWGLLLLWIKPCVSELMANTQFILKWSTLNYFIPFSCLFICLRQHPESLGSNNPPASASLVAKNNKHVPPHLTCFNLYALTCI